LAAVPPHAPALCFTHSPDVFPDLPATCGLTVAGHTHGGQVWLPLLGRPAVAGVSIYGQRYAIGIIREGGKTLFVSPGIGTSGLPMRFRVPPEISLLEIR
jgi:predicted MPP superfamily phosphohydrolase